MIVRCKNCSSAYAVNDEKVANKKFAFSCPKCGTENIVDNTGSSGDTSVAFQQPASEQGRDFDDIMDNGSSEEMSFDDAETPDDTMPGPDSEEDSGEDEGSVLDDLNDIVDNGPEDGFEAETGPEAEEEFLPDDGLSAETGPEAEEEFLPDDGLAADTIPEVEEEFLPDDELAADTIPEAEEELLPDDELSADTIPEVEEELLPDDELAADTIPEAEEELLPDDVLSADTGTAVEDDEFDIGSDIDDLNLDLDEEAAVEQEDPDFGDIDIDELEESGGADFDDFDMDGEETVTDDKPGLDLQTAGRPQEDVEEEIDELDFSDIEEYVPESGSETSQSRDIEDELSPDEEKNPDMPDSEAGQETFDNEDLVDFEPLDEDDNFEEFNLDEEIAVDDRIIVDDEPPAASDEGDDDESITIDLDTLDLEFEEDDTTAEAASISEAEPEQDSSVDNGVVFEEELPEIQETKKGEPDIPEEDLDIDIDGGLTTDDILDEDVVLDDDIENIIEEDDESITLDLDDLDIDIAEVAEEKAGVPVSKEADVHEAQKHHDVTAESSEDEDEDESITLDLDSLDIPIQESEEIQEGEDISDNEKLTLQDAGLTLDELTSEEISAIAEPGNHDTDEDLKLSIDEIDPTISINTIEEDLGITADVEGDEPIILDEPDELPEIDFDSFDEDIDENIDESVELPIPDEDDSLEGREQTEKGSVVNDIDLEEGLVDIDLEESTVIDSGREISKKIKDMVPEGIINFSVDYSIKYSRIGGILRLLGLFLLGMIPHFIVYLLYAIISFLVRTINHIVVIATKEAVEDFSEMQENTLRYWLSIGASLIGFVEEMPVFAGKDSVDYPLQMKITYPLHYSRVLAFLRLSYIGIVLVTLPHLVILFLLSLILPLFTVIGVISTIIAGKWPPILFDFMSRYFRYWANVRAFMYGLVDKYPSFRI